MTKQLPPFNAPSDTTVTVFLWFISWSTAWYFIERAIYTVFQHLWPRAYADLVARGKKVTFFTFVMGCLATTIISPVCAKAYLDADNAPPLNFANPGSAEYCLLGRAVLWTQEFSRIGYSTEILFHHLGSLAAMSYLLHVRLPVKALYALYTTLITEVGSQSVYIASTLGYGVEKSRWTRRLEFVTISSLMLARWPSIIITFREIFTCPIISRGQQVLTSIATAIYAIYFSRSFVIRARRLRRIQQNSTSPNDNWSRLFRKMYSGMTLVATLVAAICLFQQDSRDTSWYDAHTGGLWRVFFRSMFASIVLPRIIEEFGDKKLQWRAYGTVFGCAVTAWYDREVLKGESVRYTAAAAIVSPLLDAAHALWSWFNGEDSGCATPPEGSQIEPALTSGGASILFATLYLFDFIRLHEAAFLSLFAHGVFTFAAERRRRNQINSEITDISLGKGPGRVRRVASLVMCAMDVVMSVSFLVAMEGGPVDRVFLGDRRGDGGSLRIGKNTGLGGYLVQSVETMRRYSSKNQSRE
ncbi:hypothetical protein K474DRAFT_1666538 [Panus rudis PR-1116 ss-1]|nr:hypothetical protein K474DRAFT_1666538 [Panus rudis PR-1116 ss-1]